MEKWCEEKHKRMDDRLSRNEQRLNNHSGRLDEIEKKQERHDERMDNLIEQLKTLNSLMRWAIGLGATTLLGFFIRAVEKGLMG